MGGLYKKMPWTFVFTLIGGLSISAFPLFSGFVSKSMIVAAGFEEHQLLGRLSAAAGLRGHLPAHRAEGALFHLVREEQLQPRDLGAGRRAALEHERGHGGCRAALHLHRLLHALPLQDAARIPVEYHPYTAYHVSETLQILLFTGLGFFLLLKKLVPEADDQPGHGLVLPHGRTGRSVGGPQARPDGGHLCRRTLPPLRSPLMMDAARISAWFDRQVIDGAVDGLADSALRWAGSCESPRPVRCRSMHCRQWWSLSYCCCSYVVADSLVR